MGKYISAAEGIAPLAVGADGCRSRRSPQKADRVPRIDLGAKDMTEHVDYSGEYVFRV
jgi:hypothetical protein